MKGELVSDRLSYLFKITELVSCIRILKIANSGPKYISLCYLMKNITIHNLM